VNKRVPLATVLRLNVKPNLYKITARAIIFFLISCAMKEIKATRESVMAFTRNYNRSPYGMACTQCDDILIVPRETRYICKRAVYHFWSCENCGHQLDMTITLRDDKQ
jgi:RNase P subunit RPR2